MSTDALGGAADEVDGADEPPPEQPLISTTPATLVSASSIEGDRIRAMYRTQTAQPRNAATVRVNIVFARSGVSADCSEPGSVTTVTNAMYSPR